MWIVRLMLPVVLPLAVLAATEMQAGVGRVRITPASPVRMSGYADRTKPSAGIHDDLWAKALAFRHGSDSAPSGFNPFYGGSNVLGVFGANTANGARTPG